MKTDWKSKNEHRFADNPLEKRFVDFWNSCNNGRTLEYLFAGEALSERDQTVAATVIQWLGSPVGKGFLSNVLKRNIS